MSLDRYLDATRRIPPGETRTYRELAALAGRPGAARAAGRALARCPATSRLPWHRVVAAGGGLARDEARAARQLGRLRREGARPRARETVRQWAARVGAPFVAHLGGRITLPADDPRIDRWPAARVEAQASLDDARRRGLSDAGSGSVRRASAHRPRAESARALSARVTGLDWPTLTADLAARGLIHVPALLSPAECGRLIDGPHAFERHVEMAARGYGVGAYDYWAEPPPEPLGELRRLLYARLRPAADDFVAAWEPSGGARPFEPTLDGFHERCRRAGQERGSCILLRYETGGINHLHRDLYGDVWFPYQALVVLGRHGTDFDGGDFLLVEERPDGDVQDAVTASEGDLVVFAVVGRLEPRSGRPARVPLRHGMAEVTAGERWGAGLVFHLKK